MEYIMPIYNILVHSQLMCKVVIGLSFYGMQKASI